MFQERLLNAGNIACSPGNIDECSRVAEPDGFLLVANNEMLDSWEHPPWLGPNWVVVRFNHCAVRWPQGEVRREFIVQSTDCQGGQIIHHGGEDAQSCADKLDHPVREDDLLSLGTAGGDYSSQEQSCDLQSMHAGPQGKPLSTGGIIAFTLAHFYPSTPIVAAGFDQEASTQGPRWEGHAWDYEAEMLQALVAQGRLRVLRNEEEMRAVGGALLTRNSTAASAFRVNSSGV